MRKYIRLVIMVGFYLLCNYWWVRRHSRHPERYPLDYRYKKAREMVHVLDKAAKVDYIVEGKENIPQDSLYVLTPNHLSFYDPLALVSIIERHQTFVSKIEAKKYPIVGRMVKSIDGVFLDRKDLKQELKIMRHVKNSLANKENNWVIFPEGSRTEDAGFAVGTFKAGSLKMAVDTETPIVPVAIYGTQRPLSFKIRYKRYPVHIRFLPAIKPEDIRHLKTVEVAEMVERMVKEAVKELVDKDAEYLKNLKKKS